MLAGVAISSVFTGATTLMQYFADEIQLSTLVFWTFGSLENASWGDVGKMAVVFLAATLYFLLHRWDFNALLSGGGNCHQLRHQREAADYGEYAAMLLCRCSDCVLHRSH